MYLGEIVRLIAVSLVDAVPQPLLFKGKSTAALNKHYGLDTSFMSQVEEAWIGEDRSEDAFELPPLGSVWDESKLNAKVLPKLQRLREIVATTLEYKLEDVSYRDAAVSLIHPSQRPMGLDCFTDSSMVIRARRESLCCSKRSCSSCCFGPDWPWKIPWRYHHTVEGPERHSWRWC